MIDMEATPRRLNRGSGGSTVSLFLGLYLLVLAFFILLVSISTLEKVKSQAVMDSLSSTFSTILPPTAEITVFSAKRGDIVISEEFQSKITTMFTHALHVAKVEVVHPGRLMRVVLPTDALFDTGEPTIRVARVPLLDRIVAVLSTSPPGVRHDMDFVVGAATMQSGGGLLPVARSLEIQRAGTFAQTILARGAPPHAVSIGIRPGKLGETVIWFHARLENEIRRGDDEENTSDGR